MYVHGISMVIVDTEKAVVKDISKKFVMKTVVIFTDALKDIRKHANII